MKALLLLTVLVPLGMVAQSAEKTAPATTEFAPLDYFQNNCARCHGNYGEFYGESLLARLNDAEMLRGVKEMAEGPGNAPLSPRELEVETAWHIALRDRQPFVAVVSSKEGQLRGETMPGSKVNLVDAGKSWPASVDGHNWVLRVPSGIDWQTAKIEVTQGDKSKSVSLASAAHS